MCRRQQSGMNKINKIDACYIQNLVKKGGPAPEEYDELNAFFIRLGDLVRSGSTNRKELNQELWKLLGEACSLKTMQGRTARKPHGYAGDYEIIDNIYNYWISPEPHLEKWDLFFHSHSAVSAVRNRKKFFIELLKKETKNKKNEYRVLIVGSGPAREIYEFCSMNNTDKIFFDCIDMDSNAIKHSMELCSKYSDNITFHCKNIFRYKAGNSYGLVWAAGIFDYLEDKRFIFLLKRLYSLVLPGGRLIIGNFSTFNPSRDYMEAGDWYLFHRSEKQLISLAKESGIEKENFRVTREQEKVNLFIHIYK